MKRKLSAFIMALAITFVFGALPSVSAADYTPKYITTTFKNSPTDSRAFTWHTAAPADTNIKYYKSDMGEPSAVTVPISSKLAMVHKAELTGLSRGTTYYYQVGGNGVWSEWRSFTTEAVGSGASFTFAHITDSQGKTLIAPGITEGAAQFKHTITSAMKEIPDLAFFINTGDVVDEGNIMSEYQSLFEQGQGVIDQIPMMTVPGNHDERDPAKENLPSFFNLPGNGAGMSPFEGGTYSFDYGAAHFVGIDSNVIQKATVELSVLKDWLETDLRMTDKKRKVVFMHHGPYLTDAWEAELADYIRAEFVPIFDKYGVDLVLSGHDHHYGRTFMLKGVLNPLAKADANPPDLSLYPQIMGSATGTYNTPVYREGTVYMLGNSTGAKFYNHMDGNADGVPGYSFWANNLPWFDKIAQPYFGMFTAYTVTGDSITAKAYTVDSSGDAILFDSFKLDRYIPLAAEPVVKTAATGYAISIAGALGDEYSHKKVTLIIAPNGTTWETYDGNGVIHVNQQNADFGGRYTFRVPWQIGEDIRDYEILVNVDGEPINPQVKSVTALSDMFESNFYILFTGDKCSAEITIDNLCMAPGYLCTAVMAAYEADGKLAGVSMKNNLTVTLDGLSEPLTYDNVPSSVSYIKVMLFTDLSSLIPYLTKVNPALRSAMY